MKLYIGGAYQGQEELARQENPEGVFFPDFHETIREAVLKNGREARAFAEEFCREHPEAVVIANEVGAGVVPLAAEDRAFREAAGRLRPGGGRLADRGGGREGLDRLYR